MATDENLIAKMIELEDEYGVTLLTEDEVQEFLKSDLAQLEYLVKREVDRSDAWDTTSEIKKAWAEGINQGLFLAKQYYDTRIDEGF